MSAIPKCDNAPLPRVPLAYSQIVPILWPRSHRVFEHTNESGELLVRFAPPLVNQLAPRFENLFQWRRWRIAFALPSGAEAGLADDVTPLDKLEGRE